MIAMAPATPETDREQEAPSFETKRVGVGLYAVKRGLARSAVESLS
jgi:hypothetical protein